MNEELLNRLVLKYANEEMTIEEAHDNAIRDYCKKTAPTNEHRNYAEKLAWEMLNNMGYEQEFS